MQYRRLAFPLAGLPASRFISLKGEETRNQKEAVMAPNTSKSDECNNNHALHKTAAAGLSLSKAAASALAAAAAVLQ